MNCSLNVTPYRPYKKPKKSFKNVTTETTKKLKGVVNSCVLRQQDFCLQSSSVWELGSRKEPFICRKVYSWGVYPNWNAPEYFQAVATQATAVGLHPPRPEAR